jgi:HAMP domain-containing protein
MIHNKFDVLMPHADGRPSEFDRALDAEATQQGENDSRRRRLLGDEKRRQAAVYEEKSLHHTITHLRFLPSGQESTDRFINSVIPEKGPVRDEIVSESGQTLSAQPQPARSSQTQAEPYISVGGHLAPPTELYRTIATRAGLLEGPNQSDPTRLFGAASGKEGHEARLGEMPGGNVGSDPIALLSSRYTGALHGQLAPVVQQHLSLGREDQFTRELSDNLKSGQVHSQAETHANEQERRSDNAQIYGRDPRSRSLRLAYQPAQVEGMIPSEIVHDRGVGASAIDSVVAGFGQMFGQGDHRGNSRTTFDQDAGWNTDDRHCANTATNGSPQDATAAAADEIERLRAAVRRTIDELERVRGSVQPPLPALPLNRGAFRIS